MSAGGMGECCLSGKIHSGKPAGREEQLGGLNVYVSEPPSGSKAKTVVFLSDIFGWQLTNTRLCADEYARAGFYVYLPDFFFGDSVSEEIMKDAEPPLKDREELSVVDKTASTAKIAAILGPWQAKHRESVSKPLVDGFLNAVKHTPGVNKVGTIGFCWGGRYAILNAHGQVDAAVAFHPTWVSFPADLNDISKPLFIGHAEKDSLVSTEDANKMKQALVSNQDVPSHFEVYQDQVHGFSLRGDWSSEKEKEAMDRAHKQGIDWFTKYFA